MGNYPARVRRDLGVGPRGNSRRALAPWTPANQQSPSGDRFSRRADMFPVIAAEFTAEGTANVMVNKHIPLWGLSLIHI